MCVYTYVNNLNEVKLKCSRLIKPSARNGNPLFKLLVR